MPTNVTFEYENAEKEYLQASTFSEKIICLKKMLTAVPKHKGTENLRNDIKRRISKYKSLVEREKKISKSNQLKNKTTKIRRKKNKIDNNNKE